MIPMLSISVSLLGTLIVAVWKISALKTALETSLVQIVRRSDDLERRQGQLAERLEELDAIPILQQRVTQLEFVQNKNVSLFPRVAVLESQVGSIRSMRKVDPNGSNK